QPVKIHLLHPPDFIPEGDVELRRQIAEYNKQMKTEVFMENINGNDLQPRITAAIQTGAGADIILMFHNWPHLYAASLADVSERSLRVEGQGAGRLLRDVGSGGARWQPLARPALRHHRQPDRLSPVVVRLRGRLRTSQDLGRMAQDRRRPQAEGETHRPDARAHVRRRADLHLSA